MGSEHPFSHKNLKFQWTIYRPGTAESGKGEAKPFLGCGMGEAITGMGSRLPDALCFQFLFLKPILTITRLKNTNMTMKAFFSIFTCGMGETTTRMGQGSLMRVRQVEHPMDIKFDTIGMGTSVWHGTRIIKRRRAGNGWHHGSAICATQ